ncbi:hypothetical protein [Gimesia aquarii]|uniref:Uncharacterized protein n=1 Tax=Gimesia aquarii TaxID=2527964 RepID=A0A517WVZ3_9PLAN|nr:hypothetical protein [Gimesia aquarii]QDU09399.1 hypothetical protein V202x_27740 [Gimesia aquarii]
MKKSEKRDLLYVIGVCFVLVILFFLWFLSYNASKGYWEAEVDSKGPGVILTIRRAGTESDHLSRRILFKDIGTDVIKSGTFKLPDEADEMSGIKMTFQDITLRPGRVMLQLNDHEIDIMVAKISVDSQIHAWDQAELIEILD